MNAAVRRAALATGVLPLLLVAPGHAKAAAKPRSALPTLLARASSPAGRTVAKRITLGLLDPAQFTVTRRPDAASVTLGWPATKPCAFSTYTLSIAPGAGDAAAATQAVVPDADATGTATRLGKQQLDGTRPAFTGAWRQRSTILDSDRLVVRAVAATPLLDSYGDAAGGLLELDLRARTVPKTRCSGPNRFRVGPNITETIITTA